MADIASYLAALVGVIGAMTLALQGSRTTSQHRIGVVGLLSLAGTIALAAPATLRLAVQIEPIPHLVRAANATLAMVGSYCLVGIVLCSTRSPNHAARLTRKHRAILMICVAVVITCLYVSEAPPSALRTPTDNNLWLTAFLALRFVYTGLAVIAFLILSYRAIRLPETSPMMRLGFRMGLIAAATATGHALWSMSVNLHLLRAPINQDITALILSATLTLFALGITAPVWGRMLWSAVTRLRVRRSQRALNVLWSDLADLRAAVTAMPVSSVPATIQDLAVGELYQSWLALRDLQLAARPLVHPSVPAWVAEVARRHDLSEGATSTIIEAAELGTALDAVCGGASPRTSTVGSGKTLFERRKNVRRSTDTPPGHYTTQGLIAEARHLGKVWYALRHSPLVAEIRRLATSGLPGSARERDAPFDATR